VIEEFFHVALKRFAKPMSVSEAEHVPQHRCSALGWLCILAPALSFEGLRIADRHRMSWYDSLIVAAAREGHCQRLYSYRKDFQRGRKIRDMRIENRFV